MKVTGDKIFTIIAGINGAGKTSLYRVLHPTEDLGERINIDELALEHSGDWRDPRSQIYAGREAVARIRSCIENGRSFHLETTLPGASIIRHINLAKEHGFKHDEVVFVGDDYGLGGNDESVYKSDFNFLTIDNYLDFPKVVEELLK